MSLRETPIEQLSFNPFTKISSEDYRRVLNFFGTKTGRDCDKAKETGLTPVFDMNAPYYEEADMVFICKKIYCQDIAETSFVAEEDNSLIKNNYPENDFHRMYVGQIERVLTKNL